MTVSSMVRLSITKALSIRSPSSPPFTRPGATGTAAVTAEPTACPVSGFHSGALRRRPVFISGDLRQAPTG